MAFNIKYLGKVGVSQQYDRTYNPATGLSAQPGIQLWTYDATAAGSNEAIATVDASAYFNTMASSFRIGDQISVSSNDPGGHLLYVSAVSPNVTTVLVV